MEMDIEIGTPKAKPKPRLQKPFACYLGCFGFGIIVLLGSVLCLAWYGCYFHPSVAFYWRTTYPFIPVTSKPDNEEWRRYLENKENAALPKEENMALFVGTWQLEVPYNALFTPYNDGWKKTRLKIQPDGTFILTDPPRDLDYLQGFRETLEGEWCLFVMSSNAKQPVPLSVGYKTRKGSIGLRAMDLRTLRRHKTDKEFLRLVPHPSSADDYVVPTLPVWKRVVDE
ncbi:MAG: hypothetical protein FWE67_15975 [Planctomycetaceae bacterium]|nr:hypothetical protein [Planctomycetaceae bacterium]